MATIPNPFAGQGGGLPTTGGTLTGPLTITGSGTVPLLLVTGTNAGGGAGSLGTGLVNITGSCNFSGVYVNGTMVNSSYAATQSNSFAFRSMSAPGVADFQGASSSGALLLKGGGGADIGTAGLSIANGGGQAGTNSKIGTGSLSAGGGVGTVANTSVTANSYIFITDTNTSVTNVGNLAVISQSAGVNFVVKSTNASDASTFNYFIVEPG